jgi:hypothetical protein
VCNCADNSTCTCPVRVELERVDSTRASGGAYTCGGVELPRGHNRWRLAVAVDAGVTAGDVAADVELEDPTAPSKWRASNAGTVAWAANGGQLTGSLAPVGRTRIRARITGYVGGAGLFLRLFLESWREAM